MRYRWIHGWIHGWIRIWISPSCIGGERDRCMVPVVRPDAIYSVQFLPILSISFHLSPSFLILSCFLCSLYAGVVSVCDKSLVRV